MLRTFYKIATFLIIALGVIHILVTPFGYSRISLNAMWFVAAGMTIIFAGFLNIVLIRQVRRDVVVWVLSMLANLSCLLLFVSALFLLPEPQVYIGLILFACETAAAFQVGSALSVQTVNN